MILELFLPKSMNEITFKIVGSMLEKGCIAPLFANFRIALSKCIQAFLFRGLNYEGIHVHWPRNTVSKLTIQYVYGLHFFVVGSNDTIVKVQLIKTSSSLTSAPSFGAFATCIVISRLLLPVAYVTRPDNWRSQISVSGEWMVIRSQLAVTVVTSSPVCLSTITIRRVFIDHVIFQTYTQ